MSDTTIAITQESDGAAHSDIFLENEREANLYVARCMRIMAIVAALSWLANILHIFIIDPRLANIGMPLCILSLLLPSFACWFRSPDEDWIKYVAMFGVIAAVSILYSAIPRHTLLAWLTPVMLSCHYYSRRLTQGVMYISVVCLILASALSLYVGEWDSNVMGMMDYEANYVRNVDAALYRRSFTYYFIPRAVTLFGMSFIGLYMSKRTHILLKRQEQTMSDQQRIGTELNVAASIQSSMLQHKPLSVKGASVCAGMTPAKEVGGDFYDYYMIDDDHLAITVADVSGKGVGAALFMSRSMTLLKSNVKSGSSPAEVLASANEELCLNNEEMFVTVWLGILELSTGKLTFGNAGHEPPLLRHNGSYAFVTQKPGFVLGCMENVPYQDQELQLEAGDLLFQYTDGITEATTADGEQFGMERLLEAVNARAGLSGKELLVEMLNRVMDFTGDAPQYDDVTMLALSFHDDSDGN